MVRPAGPPGAITDAVFPPHRSMLRAQQRAADAYLPLSGALKARNTRDALESTAVQLITPNLPKRPTTKPRTSAGKISKTIFTAKLIGLSHFGATLPPAGYSILFDGGHPVGPTKETKWRSDRQPRKRRLGFNAGFNRSVGNAAAWKNLTNFRVLIMTGRPKRLKTGHESGFKAHPPSLREAAFDPQAHGFAAVASDPSHEPFGYAAARRVSGRPPAAVCWQDPDR
jgi:hypothetical protein